MTNSLGSKPTLQFSPHHGNVTQSGSLCSNTIQYSMAASSLILIHTQIKYNATKTKSLRVILQSSKLLVCSVVVETITFIRHACNLWNIFNSSLILPMQPYLAKMLLFLLLKYIKYSAAEQLEQMMKTSSCKHVLQHYHVRSVNSLKDREFPLLFHSSHLIAFQYWY